ncbi:hypothetical protein Ccrd_012864 [Cynara cardunculus var. scolymus]|uniref:Uncharacterized protein n=1 Tax=Cynara cardunculus var. scolymus TaxID=59895 RepID=A0A118K594_CYNCS|nr:hypothetical protein Ccrd_012864 [Cynara cardunculus var. scolymus]
MEQKFIVNDTINVKTLLDELSKEVGCRVKIGNFLRVEGQPDGPKGSGMVQPLFNSFIDFSSFPNPNGLKKGPPGYAGFPDPENPFSRPKKYCFPMEPGLYQSWNLRCSAKPMSAISITNRVPAGGMTPVWNHGRAVSAGMRPSFPKISGAMAPAAPSMANRPLMTSP